tara:strand:+ start:2807 stop:3241 length:435 start_codon:yes stop_codon:yes gene_type:complete
LKKALALFLLISFIPLSLYAQEQRGRYTRLLEGNPSPFDAWCFDDPAFAMIKARIDTMEEARNLAIQKAVEQERAKYSLKVKNLELRLVTLKKETDNILSIKNEEIKKLETAALKRPGNYSIWWATGGIAVGVLSTLAIVFAVK